MELDYRVQIWQEGDQFVAHAMPLDVASSGSTVEQARDALAEAITLFVNTAREHGTLTEVLEESGYVQERGKWQSPAAVATEKASLRFAA